MDSHGELIDPPRALASRALALADGTPRAADVFQRHWSLIIRPAQALRRTNDALLDELARVRLALDKDAGRVRRVLLHAAQCATFGCLLAMQTSWCSAATDEASLRKFPPAVGRQRMAYI